MKPVLASSSLVGQPKMEGAAEWTAIGLENRGMALTVGVRFLHLPPKFSSTTRGRKARHCADNAEIAGALPA